MKTTQLQKNNPEGWKYVQLEDLVKTSSGGTPKSDNASYYEYGTIPWLTSGEVRKGRINTFDNFITKEGLENSSAKIFPPKTILVAMYGATAGQVGILEKEASTNQAICGILPNEKYSSLFLYHYFTTRTRQLLIMGTGAAQPNISQEILRTLDLHLPPLPEQHRIVAVLATWDNVIEKLAKKIEIKKEIKKGLMQDLLTGKKRVEGFKGEWKYYVINNVCNIIKNGVKEFKDVKKYYSTSAILDNSKIEYLSYNNRPSRADMLPEINDIGIAKMKGTNRCFVVNKDLYGSIFSTGFVFLRTKEDFDYKFLFFLFSTDYFQFLKDINSASGIMGGINNSDLLNIELKIPTSKQEQQAIADILMSADNEIKAIEKKLEIIKEQKKYLLNNLITGKIRTPENMKINKNNK